MTDFNRKTAHITLPITNNDGEPVDTAHAHLLDTLRSAFGGVTYFPVSGQWADASGQTVVDHSIRYECAMSPDVSDGKVFVAAARMACIMAEQQCVMVQLAAGNVVFVDKHGDMS